MWLQQNFWWLALLLTFLWFFKAYLSPVGGAWYIEGEASSPWQLTQFGPWVFGAQNRPDGVYKFQGRLKGSVWHISRRDHGAALFEAQGFPPAIAFLLSGRTMVEYRLQYRASDRRLIGSMIPLKVTFVLVPPQVSDFTRQEPVAFILTKK